MTATHVKFTDVRGCFHVERWERVRIDGQRVYVGDLKDADLRWYEVGTEERDRLVASLTGEERPPDPDGWLGPCNACGKTAVYASVRGNGPIIWCPRCHDKGAAPPDSSLPGEEPAGPHTPGKGAECRYCGGVGFVSARRHEGESLFRECDCTRPTYVEESSDSATSEPEDTYVGIEAQYRDLWGALGLRFGHPPWEDLIADVRRLAAGRENRPWSSDVRGSGKDGAISISDMAETAEAVYEATGSWLAIARALHMEANGTPACRRCGERAALRTTDGCAGCWDKWPYPSPRPLGQVAYEACRGASLVVRPWEHLSAEVQAAWGGVAAAVRAHRGAR